MINIKLLTAAGRMNSCIVATNDIKQVKVMFNGGADAADLLQLTSQSLAGKRTISQYAILKEKFIKEGSIKNLIW